jgi:hypothetical protein
LTETTQKGDLRFQIVAMLCPLLQQHLFAEKQKTMRTKTSSANFDLPLPFSSTGQNENVVHRIMRKISYTPYR